MPNIEKIRVDGTDYDLVAPEIYDGTERVIGTWFGEPIYRKVLSLTAEEIQALSTDTRSRYLYPLNLDISDLLRADLTVQYTVNNKPTKKCYASHIINSVAEYDVGVHSIENGTLIFLVGPLVLANLTSTANIILEYTKATVNNQVQSEE